MPCRRVEQEVEAAFCLWINSCGISLGSLTFPLTCVKSIARQGLHEWLTTSFFLFLQDLCVEREKVIRAGANLGRKFIAESRRHEDQGGLFKALS